MPATHPDILADIAKLIKDVDKAARKDSPGGVKVTANEWLQIGIDAGFVVVDVIEAVGNAGH